MTKEIAPAVTGATNTKATPMIHDLLHTVSGR